MVRMIVLACLLGLFTGCATTGRKQSFDVMVEHDVQSATSGSSPTTVWFMYRIELR